MPFIQWIGRKKLFILNEGGRGITITFQPFAWLRVYAWGKVFELGGYRQRNCQ